MQHHGTQYQQLNANGARLHLLLGREDWGRCLDSSGTQRLSAWWPGDEATGPAEPPPGPLAAWDESAHQLTLQPWPITLPPTLGEVALHSGVRRAAAADRNGNVYRIGDDRRTVWVHASGSGREGRFWPPLAEGCADDSGGDGGFAPLRPASPPPPQDYLALAVTTDHHLVVAFVEVDGRSGLLGFDLVGGGPPLVNWWPAGVITPYAMCTRRQGGLWLLDRDRLRLWELDGQLAVVRRGGPVQPLAATDDFAPMGRPARERPARSFPAGLDLATSPALVVDPVALLPTLDGAVLLLDVDPGSTPPRSRVLRLARQAGTWQHEVSAWIEGLHAHDFVLDAEGRQLFISPDTGNQALAFGVDAAQDRITLRRLPELYPLRRHGGRALLLRQGQAAYDSGSQPLRWVPIVRQPRRQWAASAELLTPVFDSREPQITWDKLLLDACIPPDTRVEIQSRASDEIDVASAMPLAPWQDEPALRLRERGSELPWLREQAEAPTRREQGHGTWELLLQRAQGRYLQLRLTLSSRQRTHTPRLRALRLWAPRFSYPQRFLPAVYREEPAAAGFLERWLANFESCSTEIEDRIAQMHVLLDPRSAPTDALAWLAEWFDLALDPAWDEARRRLFLRHAVDYFRWRGTAYGLRLALELGFAEQVQGEWFAGPEGAAPLPQGPGQIRIVEAYQTRLLGGAAAGDAAALVGPARVLPGQRWTPAEGNAGLVERWARWRDTTATAQQQLEAFDLVAPEDTQLAKAWPLFCQAALGFVPRAGAEMRRCWLAFLRRRHGRTDATSLPGSPPAAGSTEADDWADFCSRPSLVHQRWQAFLGRRHRRIEKLRSAWGQGAAEGWAALDQVPLPDRLPEHRTAQADWLQFEREVLAMHQQAHRFSVLLPLSDLTREPLELERRLALARRIVALEKPAHTVFDVRFFWAFNRIGEARLGQDTQLGDGSRAAELIPDAVVGRAYLGASFVAGPPAHRGGDRLSLPC